MTAALAILAELLGFATTLILLGEPLRMLVSRLNSFFRTLDLVEICILDVYLGGLILYVLALLPFHLFNTFVVVSLLLVSSILLAIRFLKSTGKTQKVINGLEHPRRRTKILEYVFVLASFCLALYIQILPLTSLVYGSIHDTSYHSLLTEVIIENRGMSNTLEPYLPEGVIYPQGAHVIFAYASNLTGWIAPHSVFYVTPLFSALTVLAAYFMARKLWTNRIFYLGTVFVFAFLASWPMFITWGANPFVVGLPFFLICLTMVLSLLFDSDKKSKWELCFIGVLFGYLGAIMISFLQTLLAILIIGLLVKLFLRHPHMNRKVKDCSFLFAVSLIQLSPFLFRFIFYYPNIGHNIGLPSDFIGYPKVHNQLGQGLQWGLDSLSPYSCFRVTTIGICILSALLFFMVGRGREMKRAFSATAIMFGAALSLSLLSEVLPADFSIASSIHQVIMVMVSLYLLVALFNQSLFAFWRRVFSKLLKTEAKGYHAATLISILILLLVYAPFVSVRLSADPSTLRGAYGVFAITTNDDAALMLWMKENLRPEDVILVNQYESGLFVPAVSNRKAIFATPGSQLSRGYQELSSLLRNGTLNATCFNIMKNLGITHVYVGSVATYWWIGSYRWNPQLFLDNVNAHLIKRIGEAYLFQVFYESQ